ncbi:ABC transporter D family member 2-like isoform X1 [Schistocerca gregaria]|uniref:ABC transporter D family member 2-like isoform X1 n=1 Tax=Schistocerca gregaria TaxID=7010 RepID=UPI00211E500F|nr:ABC transporter D family member 2-like isoform X1 [Schistocerca gregaria]XP_049849116.1 ABC transporter D family member 2-like isoform X1 [Schistocerca gregaria]
MEAIPWRAYIRSMDGSSFIVAKMKTVFHPAFRRHRIKTVFLGLATLGAGFYMLCKRLGAQSQLSYESPKELQVRFQPKQEYLKVNRVFLHQMGYLLKIIIPGPISLEAICVALLTFFLLVRTRLSIRIVEIMGLNASALVRTEFRSFVRGVLSLGLIAVPASIVNSLLKFLTNFLALRFRKRLTTYAHEKYLNSLTFRRTILDRSIDGIDQRISQDIDQLSKVISEFYPSTFKPLVDVALFTHKLTTSVGYEGAAMICIYYMFSGFILRRWLPDFAFMTSKQQELEGNFRYYHTRLLMHAEEIAFYRGWNRERKLINDTFDRYYRHCMGFLVSQAVIDVFDSWLVKYGATLVGYLVVAIPVFGGVIASRGGDQVSLLTESYVQNTQILINLSQSIGQVVLLYKRLTRMAGYTSRVFELFSSVDAVDFLQEDEQRVKKGDLIEFDSVDISTPNRELMLVESLSFQVRSGEHTIIMGPNGCGKSSIFRVLAGLWPALSGTIYCPSADEIFFIPQRPYFPVASLREQVIYPDRTSDASRKGVSDEQLLSILADTDLAYLVKREGGWDAQKNWTETFSGGEKQKINLCRAFYHRPKFVCLDECTSAVSVDIEGKLYKRLIEIGCTIVTISHRKHLQQYHKRLIQMTDSNGYSAKLVGSQ